MRKFVAKNIAYPLQDWYNRTSILQTHRFLLETQFWPESRMLDYQFGKFKKLIEHAYRNVPYYNKLFSGIKLKPADISSFEDLQKIPILTKEIARKENNNLIVRNLPKKNIHDGVTGGTTGPPLKLLRDPGDLTFTWAAFFRWYNWMGIDIGDKVSKIWGTRTVLSMPWQKRVTNNLKNWYYNRSIINSFNLNLQTIPGVIDSLNRFEPRLIRGYLSAFIQIAGYMRDNNLKFTFKPVAISSTTETLLEPFRRLVQDQFGAKLYDQYGCGECNSIAFEAGDGAGMYIASEHVKLEILSDAGVPEINKEGRIVFTNLDNYAMPFIRYENGDSGQLAGHTPDQLYSFPRLDHISGRTTDTIILANGSKVHGVFFTDILNELYTENQNEVHRFQVYQQNPGEIEFRIESKINPGDHYLKTLEGALYRFFKKVVIKTMTELPRDASGKFRYIIHG